MRILTAVIAIAAGILTLLGYFFPAFTGIQITLLNWTVILVGMAAIVGVFNLLIVHTDKIRRREKNSGYSAFLVAGLAAALVFGMMRQTAITAVMMNGVILPAEAALMGLLVVSLLYAAMRLLRRRSDAMSVAFLVSAALLILGFATLPFGNIPIIDVAARWITQTLALGGARGILIGVALGALTTGLRVLFGVDRPYGGN
ncbi:MAG: hypothetical protein Fur002_06990 [Anaerolineales bacterium]